MLQRYIASVTFDVVLLADSEGEAQRLALWHLRDGLRNTEDGVTILQRPIHAVKITPFATDAEVEAAGQLSLAET